ncbi:MAG: C-GCAxxG-C-C family protein [Clostridiales bacterium]|nr:C-GCAxxG-C-C family protein [Clostridiales bacterium]
MDRSKLLFDSDQYLEKAGQLRADRTVHYNCAQAVIIPFAKECGISENKAFALGMHFGGGMKMGSICGAVAGAAMVIGMMGGGDQEYQAFLRAMKEHHGDKLDCAVLLRKNAEAGGGRKTHCDGMIYEAIENIVNCLQ